MSHSPDRGHFQLSNVHDDHHPYLEDMDYYDDPPRRRLNVFPWVAGLGICLASAGVGMAFTWLLSPPEAANRESRQAEELQAPLADSDGEIAIDPEQEANSERGNQFETEDDPLGIPLEDLPLIPVDPSVTSQVRPSRIVGSVEDTRRNGDAADSQSALAVNPAIRPQSDYLNRWESERESSLRELSDNSRRNRSGFGARDSADIDTDEDTNTTIEGVLEPDRDASADSSVNTALDADTEQVESRNVAVATPSAPRLDLGPSLGEGSYLVLMAYQGDNSLSRAREFSQGAFIKQLNGKTYVQLAAFDQLEYARHMADDLRRQGESVLILQ